MQEQHISTNAAHNSCRCKLFASRTPPPPARPPPHLSMFRCLPPTIRVMVMLGSPGRERTTACTHDNSQTNAIMLASGGGGSGVAAACVGETANRAPPPFRLPTQLHSLSGDPGGSCSPFVAWPLRGRGRGPSGLEPGRPLMASRHVCECGSIAARSSPVWPAHACDAVLQCVGCAAALPWMPLVRSG